MSQVKDITPDEFAEVITLAQKGYANLSAVEQTRWTELHAKALIAQSTRIVEQIIEVARDLSHLFIEDVAP